MTLQASGAISLTDVINELRIPNSGRSAIISLGDSDVLALAGKAGAPISLGDLYGKSSFSATWTGGSTSVSTLAGATTCSAYPSTTVKGGSGTISYQWTITSYTGLTPTLANANGSYCQVYRACSKSTDGSFDAVLQCVINDSAGHSITLTGITAHGDWYSNR